MIKSPLRYPGGKSRAVSYLNEFIPEYKEFRDVFFGGGSLSLHCLQSNKKAIYEASDLNYELYCFWSQLRNNSNDLISAIQEIYSDYKTAKSKTTKQGKDLFDQVVKRRNDDLTELQRAIDFFILNRITFSGVVDAGGYSKGSFEGRFTQSAINRLSETVTLIQSINFYCEDYSYLVNKEGEEVFIFLDPPYYSATKSKLYGRNGILHTSFNHENLNAKLKNIKHHWLITYDDSDFIKNLYRDFYQVQWKLQYGMTNSNNSASILGNELLISNYDLNKVRENKLKHKLK